MATVWMKPQTCLKAEGNQWDTGVSGRVEPSPRCRKAIVVFFFFFFFFLAIVVLAETSPGGFEAWVIVAGAMKSENTTGMLFFLCKSLWANTAEFRDILKV